MKPKFERFVWAEAVSICRVGYRHIKQLLFSSSTSAACFLLASCPSYTSTLKTEAVQPSETSVNVYQTARRHISDYSTLHNHRCWDSQIQNTERETKEQDMLNRKIINKDRENYWNTRWLIQWETPSFVTEAFNQSLALLSLVFLSSLTRYWITRRDWRLTPSATNNTHK